MGREIRRVPAGNWHEEDENGHLQPKMNQSFREACEEWDKEHQMFMLGLNKEANKVYGISELTEENFIDWHGGRPDDPAYYRPDWKPEDMTHYQFYETVSEGTPLSPAFATLQELEDWLVNNQGHSRTAAKNFCESGWAPSMIMGPGGIKSGVDTCE